MDITHYQGLLVLFTILIISSKMSAYVSICESLYTHKIMSIVDTKHMLHNALED